MAVSDARRLKVYEQARAHWGEETAEVLMELVVPAGQDMATKADIAEAVSSMKEYTLRNAADPAPRSRSTSASSVSTSPADRGAAHLRFGPCAEEPRRRTLPI
jgi:hypothetical protein